MQMFLEMQTKGEKSKKTQYEEQGSFLFSSNFFKQNKPKQKNNCKKCGEKNLCRAGCKVDGIHLQLQIPSFETLF